MSIALFLVLMVAAVMYFMVTQASAANASFADGIDEGEMRVVRAAGMQKVLLSHMQVVGLAASLPVTWPKALVRMFGAMESVGAPSESGFPLDCLLPQPTFLEPYSHIDTIGVLATSRFVVKQYAFFAMPFIVVATIIALLAMKRKFTLLKLAVRRRDTPAAKEEAVESNKRLLSLTITVVLYLLYTTLVARVAMMFTCRRMEDVRVVYLSELPEPQQVSITASADVGQALPDDQVATMLWPNVTGAVFYGETVEVTESELWLRQDPEIPCVVPPFTAGVGVLAVILYPLGLPLLFLLQMMYGRGYYLRQCFLNVKQDAGMDGDKGKAGGSGQKSLGGASKRESSGAWDAARRRFMLHEARRKSTLLQHHREKLIAASEGRLVPGDSIRRQDGAEEPRAVPAAGTGLRLSDTEQAKIRRAEQNCSIPVEVLRLTPDEFVLPLWSRLRDKLLDSLSSFALLLRCLRARRAELSQHDSQRSEVRRAQKLIMCTEEFEGQFLSSYGFMSSSYRDSAYYWEVLTMFRKAITVLIIVVVAPAGVVTQVAAASVMVLSFMLLHALKRPYRENVLQHTELFSLAVQLFTLICAQFYITDDTLSPALGGMLAVFVALINLCLLAYMGMQIFITKFIGIASALPEALRKKVLLALDAEDQLEKLEDLAALQEGIRDIHCARRTMRPSLRDRFKYTLSSGLYGPEPKLITEEDNERILYFMKRMDQRVPGLRDQVQQRTAAWKVEHSFLRRKLHAISFGFLAKEAAPPDLYGYKRSRGFDIWALVFPEEAGVTPADDDPRHCVKSNPMLHEASQAQSASSAAPAAQPRDRAARRRESFATAGFAEESAWEDASGGTHNPLFDKSTASARPAGTKRRVMSLASKGRQGGLLHTAGKGAGGRLAQAPRSMTGRQPAKLQALRELEGASGSESLADDATGSYYGSDATRDTEADSYYSNSDGSASGSARDEYEAIDGSSDAAEGSASEGGDWVWDSDAETYVWEPDEYVSESDPERR
jgi:hypothetical protein